MKLKIVITGSKVHDVGYRVFLLKHAMNLAVPGLTVYNWDGNGQQQVIALAEGDEGRIAAFKRVAAEKRPELAEVSDVKFESYDGEIGRTSDLAMFCSFVQLDKAIPLMLKMNDRSVSMDNKLGSVDDKLGSIAEIQKETLEEIRGLREDLAGSREWQLRVGHDIKTIKNKIGIR